MAGALAAVTVGGILVVNMLPGDGGSNDAGSDTGARPTASSAPSDAAGVPTFYVGTWEGRATTDLGTSTDTYRVELEDAAVGEKVGTVTSTDLLGLECVDVLTLTSVTGRELVAAGEGAPDNGGNCAKGAHTVRLTRDGASLTYTSRYPNAGNPTADLKRVEQ
ncbi:hypothetical protein V2W30_16965 [Streptomyces sp. Q6]|uniref:Uncharacterized protein n=1 Tax=Streptomyces citrinus TaxID=3118173 RepID=A0ACD5ACD9_9ACTN